MAKPIGVVSHYFDKIGVAIIDLSAALKVGETITFEHGDETFTQEVASLQIDHESVAKAKTKTRVGIKVEQETKPGTKVFRGEKNA